MNLAVSSEPRGDAIVVRLDGDFDLYSSAEVRTSVDTLLEAGRADLFLDLTGVTFLDSSGLGTLVGLQKHANRAHVRLALCGLPPQIQKIVHATHLQDAFTILPDVPVAEPSSDTSEDGAGS
jgi:anti-anti-sigma factor